MNKTIDNNLKKLSNINDDVNFEKSPDVPANQPSLEKQSENFRTVISPDKKFSYQVPNHAIHGSKTHLDKNLPEYRHKREDYDYYWAVDEIEAKHITPLIMAGWEFVEDMQPVFAGATSQGKDIYHYLMHRPKIIGDSIREKKKETRLRQNYQIFNGVTQQTSNLKFEKPKDFTPIFYRAPGQKR
ncbi:MAG: hypothetical protein ULS35scaffold63_16 [Phage 33_17]|nr:MAG: hypothetical protein ULS35scaffold63_16 [Phage 33_17]